MKKSDNPSGIFFTHTVCPPTKRDREVCGAKFYAVNN